MTDERDPTVAVKRIQRGDDGTRPGSSTARTAARSTPTVPAPGTGSRTASGAAATT
jgi:hypothetical protein